MSNLQNEIRSLSAAEKFDLLNAVWESLETDPLPLSAEQSAELDTVSRAIARIRPT